MSLVRGFPAPLRWEKLEWDPLTSTILMAHRVESRALGARTQKVAGKVSPESRNPTALREQNREE